LSKTLKGLVPSTLLKVSIETIPKIIGIRTSAISIMAFMKYFKVCVFVFAFDLPSDGPS